MHRPVSSREDVRRPGRAVLRGFVAFLAAFGCVELYSVVDAANSSRTRSEAPPYAATDVVAPPPDQLTEWSFHLAGSSVSREEWTSLADRAIGVRDRVNEGDLEWVETVVELESLFFEVDDRLACAARYAEDVQSGCSVRYDLGIERQSKTEGRVVYSRGTSFMDDESAAEQAACELFLKCMAHSKLGGIVPIPEADWSEIVVYQLIGLLPMGDDLRVPENLRVQAGWCDDYRRELARQIHEGETERSAFVEAKMLGLENKARYFRWRADKFEEEAAG